MISAQLGAALPDVHHVGLVVRDCAESARSLSAVAGRSAMEPFEDRYSEILVEGSPRPFSLRLSFIWLGNMLVELLEPLDAHSPHAAFLEKKGEGFHHLGFRVEHLQAQLERLEARGLRRLVDATVAPDTSHWVYLGSDFAGGDIIELMSKTPHGDRFFAQVDTALGLAPPTGSS